MAAADDIAPIQSCIVNRLDRKVIGRKRIAGIIGDSPSRYSKSPSIWNTTFQALKMDALYLPFDVEEARLADLVRALKKSRRVMGANVTVPYKMKIMEYLDSVDENARQIGAVNTIVRAEDGSLIGYNTDGSGFLESISAPLPGQEKPFLESLRDTNALIIGAGGSARAVAFHLVKSMGDGQLFICNRTQESARSLASDLKEVSKRVKTVPEKELPHVAPRVGLIVNCSTKGQGGIRTSRDGKITLLEPYSALAPANPTLRPQSEDGKPEFFRDWLKDSLADIEANNRASWELALSIPLSVAFYDLIYFPAETVFLRHGRLTGHRTSNGRSMIIAQAAQAFFHNVCREYLQKRGMYKKQTYERILRLMEEAWR